MELRLESHFINFGWAILGRVNSLSHAESFIDSVHNFRVSQVGGPIWYWRNGKWEQDSSQVLSA
jgi:hypothetical protein